MKIPALRILLTLSLLLPFVLTATAQKYQKKVDEINAEGLLLYKLEKASWVGTDILMQTIPERKPYARGYFSYQDGPFTKCIFLSSANPERASITFTFDSTFEVSRALADTIERELTQHEKNTCALRAKTIDALNTDTIFKFYQGFNPNIIPIAENGKNRVYIISGATEAGILAIGNDYMLKFSNKLELQSTAPLHRSILIFSKKELKEVQSIMHNHLPEFNEMITPTDICTLLLYGDLDDSWHSHIVVSNKYVSIWNYKNKAFVAMTKKAFDKFK